MFTSPTGTKTGLVIKTPIAEEIRSGGLKSVLQAHGYLGMTLQNCKGLDYSVKYRRFPVLYSLDTTPGEVI